MKGKLLLFFLFCTIAVFAQHDSTKPLSDTLNREINGPNKMPEFPGGDAAMYKLILDNLHYPTEAKQKGITGKVFVNFIVEKDGTVQQVQVAKSVDSLLDAEAVRVVSLLANFIPGESLGKPVRVLMTLPIAFELSTVNEPVQKSPAAKKRSLLITGVLVLAALTVIMLAK
jgi:TonB family protein